MNKKLFIGFHYSHTLKMELDSLKGIGAKAIQYEGKEYLGTYMEGRVSFSELAKVQKELIEVLQPHCQSITLETLRCYVFAQTFIG